MRKTYKILVNITGKDKIYEIPFNSDREIRKDIKPTHIKIQGIEED